MKPLKSILGINNKTGLYALSVYFISRVRFLVILPVLTACVFVWPSSANREHRGLMTVSSFEYSSLWKVVKTSDQRYEALVNVGGKHCLPGQMLAIDQQRIHARYALEARLPMEAQQRLHNTLTLLHTTRQALERLAEKNGCPFQYVLTKNQRTLKALDTKDSVLGLESWQPPNDLLLLRSQ